MLDKKKKVLFLDRDGVINKRMIDGYVKDYEEFVFLPGVLDALKVMNLYFDRIFIVTNQQGIGKGLMLEKDLRKVHDLMLEDMDKKGIRIDAVFYCPHLKSTDCVCRKPKTGMYKQALSVFPDIEGADYYMVGDTVSDMHFAKNIKAFAVMISDELLSDNKDNNFVFPSLKDFAKDIHLVLG